MDLTKGDLLIFSGEGEQGTWERYEGKREAKAIRSRLSRERCGGDRWAEAWIEEPGVSDGSGEVVYGRLGRDLGGVDRERSVPASDIKINPAAMLRSGKTNSASATNGATQGAGQGGMV